jgi:hypothetical protein
LVPRTAAPVDLTGYWVSIISEDWRWRMGVGLKGDFGYVTLNDEGRRVGNAWDPARDEASGNQCKAYGAVGVMRQPTRLHITWQDDNTLRLDADFGTQTRLFHFGGAVPPDAQPTWQGYSIARWEFEGPRGAPARAGQLAVTTTNMRPGYYFKHGVPYSDKAVLREYLTRVVEDNGDQYLLVTTIVNDPVYLNGQFVRTLHFRREPDGSKWNPSPCSAR